MTTRPPLPPDVRALIEREREIPPVSAAQRARAIARAREALAKPAVTAAWSPRASSRRWIAAAAGVVASAAVAAAAYELRVALRPASPPPAHQAKPAAVAVVGAPSAPPAPAPPEPSSDPAPTVTARESSRSDMASEELGLLRQARAAVARGDFSAALRPITEHTRRFKNGRLVEEREALRVKVLVALGRTKEARHTAAAFKARFPRSVLLPAVSRMLTSDL